MPAIVEIPVQINDSRWPDLMAYLAHLRAANDVLLASATPETVEAVRVHIEAAEVVYKRLGPRKGWYKDSSLLEVGQ